MSVLEVIIFIAPLVRLAQELRQPVGGGNWRSLVYWGAAGIACFIVSCALTLQLVGLMRGRLLLGEIFYYGWFLFGLYAIMQLVKNGIAGIVVGRDQKNRAVLFLRRGVLYAILFVLMVPLFLSMTVIHRIKVGDGATPSSALGYKYEDVRLRTKDGVPIAGWFIPAASDRAVIIAHGLGANKSNFIGTVALWHQLGINVLIVDFRGHGMSGGHTVSFGYRERFDILAGLDYLMEEKGFAARNIIGYGVSFGGAAMIHAAVERPVFERLIIDSSFASLDDMAAMIVDQQAMVPLFCKKLFKEMGLFMIRLDLGVDLRKRSPINAVSRLAGIPLLFIHGTGDPLINWKQTQILYGAAQEPKQVVFLPTPGHFGTPNDPGYVELLKKFIAR